VTGAEVWTLELLNTTPDRAVIRARLGECCAAGSWVDRIVEGRPYRDVAALGAQSDAGSVDLDGDGLAEALAGHPRIGERRTEHTGTWSRQEQSGMSDADEAVRAEMAAANAEYEERFGHVYLVCATGKSATELRDICRARLTNDAATERAVVRMELAKINRLRLGKLLGADV
jgi:2-oxo-4-hydroxy-4-carboxy-5-ureidoimidazoline decarboxylase